MSQVGPGISARIRNMEFFGLSGRMLMTNTSTPMPPIQCVKQRQKFIPMGSASMSVSIVEPVVVNPDTISKKALSNLGIQPLNTKGRAPNTDQSIHASATITKPSFA